MNALLALLLSSATYGQVNLGVDQTNHYAVHRYYGHADDEFGVFFSYEWGFRHGPRADEWNEVHIDWSYTNDLYVDYYYDAVLEADTGWCYRSFMRYMGTGDNVVGAWDCFTSYAVSPQLGVPVVVPVGPGEVAVFVDYYPNTNQSPGIAVLQWRLGNGGWVNFDSGDWTWGYPKRIFGRYFGKVVPGAEYQFRLYLWRYTANENEAIGPVTTVRP